MPTHLVLVLPVLTQRNYTNGTMLKELLVAATPLNVQCRHIQGEMSSALKLGLQKSKFSDKNYSRVTRLTSLS